MPIQNSSPPQQLLQETRTTNKTRYMVLLVLNYVGLFIGNLASSLLSKFYFIHKGSSRWVSTWVQCAGFPILFIAIFLPYILKLTKRKPFTSVTRKLLLLSVLIGFGLGLNNLLFSWGTSYLPVSTSSLLLSSQLLFTLVFSCLLVKQKVTPFNLNCVILLTVSSILLAMSSSHDRPKGITNRMYVVGYFCTIGAGLLFALYLPIMEKFYREVNCYEMVVEMQLVMEIAATIFATVGLALDGGIQEIQRESTLEFDLGPRMYLLTIIALIISWQICFMAMAGMVFLTSSFTSGVCTTALLVMNVVAGVVIYGDPFSGIKVVSSLLCTWGFCSHLYGMYLNNKTEGEGISGGAEGLVRWKVFKL